MTPLAAFAARQWLLSAETQSTDGGICKAVWETLVPVLAGGTLTGLATIVAQRLQADRDRYHRIEDTHVDFQRKALLELQDALESLMVAGTGFNLDVQRGEVPDHGAGLALAGVAERVWVRAERVEDPIVRENAKTAATTATVLAASLDPPAIRDSYTATSRAFREANEQVGRIIRGQVSILPLNEPRRWWHISRG